MNESLQWLPEARGTHWEPLGIAMRAGLPVPAGFIVWHSTPEAQVRAAYDTLKLREKTHFLAVRSPSHGVLNVIGPDALVHTLRRLWAESPGAPMLAQRMIHAIWCGKAHWHRKNLRIKANEGMMILDPDTYLVNSATGQGSRRSIAPKQRKMIRHVDGSVRVVEGKGRREPMPPDQLAKVVELAVRTGTNIGWAIDDLEKVWLISVPADFKCQSDHEPIDS